MLRNETLALSARQAIDKILARKPEKSSHEFSEAVRCLCALRDHWLAERPEGERGSLERVNAVISVLIAGHFPLGSIPWTEIERARGVVSELEHSG